MVVGGSTSAVSVKEIGVKFIGEAEDFLIKKVSIITAFLHHFKYFQYTQEIDLLRIKLGLT